MVGVGVGPDVLLLLLGSAFVCGGGGGLNSDSLKKRERKLLQKTATACLNKRLGFCLLGGSSFLL